MNRFIDAVQPWSAIKNDPEVAYSGIYGSLQELCHISIALYPFTPATADRMRQQLGLEPINPDTFNFEQETKFFILSILRVSVLKESNIITTFEFLTNSIGEDL